ncbi:hypothetical protein V865_001176 [Kwoniella europaea PYCC6329]|uniref:Ubiquitin conjugation factor E4 core domain-containing protein n=1 Tax=Kwoniella europaea PYCC6329 TaxID=1423913 RepID=A0AAX4KAE1_9TREE
MSDNNELSDADKIRLKRLARLGTSTPTQQDGQTSGQASPSPAATPTTTHTPASAGSRLLSTPQPTTSTSSSPAASSSKPIQIASSSKPAAERNSTKTPTLALGKRPTSSTPTSESVGPRVVPSKASSHLARVDYKQWETKKVGEVFSVTLSKQKAIESDWRLCWLKGLEEELIEEKTTIDLSDRLLIARLSLDTESMTSSMLETTVRSKSGVQQISAFEKLKALVISYCGMTLEDPTMFPQPKDKPVGPAEFLPLLLAIDVPSSTNGDQYTSSAQSSAPTRPGALSGADLLPFLNDLAIGFPSDTMADVITPTLSLFFQEWYKITPTPDIMGADWRRYLGAVALLVQVKSIAALSLLGPLTRLNVFPREFPEIWKTYFSNPTERKKEDIEANKSNLRYTLGGLHGSLFNIYNAIVRASPESREGILDFFALTIKLNEKRAGMRIDKVDPAYYKTSKRVDITEETKIRGTKEEADEYFGGSMEGELIAHTVQADQLVDTKPNFISDLFFLTNAFIHLGVVKTIGTRSRAEKNMSEIEKELKRAEAQRSSWAGNPAMETQGEAAIKKLKVSTWVNDVADS